MCPFRMLGGTSGSSMGRHHLMFSKLVVSCVVVDPHGLDAHADAHLVVRDLLDGAVDRHRRAVEQDERRTERGGRRVHAEADVHHAERGDRSLVRELDLLGGQPVDGRHATRRHVHVAGGRAALAEDLLLARPRRKRVGARPGM
jgi:hypothetical protein